MTTGSAPAPLRSTPRAAAAILAIALPVLLVGCGTGTTTAGSSASPSSASPSASPSPTPSPTPTPPAVTLTASDIENIQESISSGNTAALEGYLSNPVEVAFAASEFDKNRTPVNAIGDLNAVVGKTGWDWNLDAATLASYAAGSYSQWFPPTAIVGRAAEGDVVAFTIAGKQITRIFVSASADLLVP